MSAGPDGRRFGRPTETWPLTRPCAAGAIPRAYRTEQPEERSRSRSLVITKASYKALREIQLRVY